MKLGMFFKNKVRNMNKIRECHTTVELHTTN